MPPASCYDKHRRWYLWHVQYAAHRIDLHLPAGIEGVRTRASVSFMHTSTGVFFLASKSMRLALSKLKKNLLRLHSWGRRSDWLLGWAVSCSNCTDQLLTPYFSGASTLLINGTPGGDRWARVLGGQIRWLSEPLHRFDADCSESTNLKMQTHGKREKIPPHRKHTTKATSARRPRPPRDGARKNTSHASAHTRPLP